MAQMPRNLYYDMDGNPITTDEWIKLVEGPDDYKRVAKDALPGGYKVSTVLLGLDHSFQGEPPIIFESMVFGPDGGGDLDCDRYSTKAQAIVGHVNMVKKWRRNLAGLKPKDTVGPMKGIRRPQIIKD